MEIAEYWSAVLEQDREAMAEYFCPDAKVFWHNTNECFTVPELIRVNCDYPGAWAGEIEHVAETGDQIITAVRIWEKDGAASFHAVSFFSLQDGRIQTIQEYWGDDGEPPRWRQEMGVGKPIR
ncbi:MAG: nuclear transport factor 2 family protein [Oscillospiraceae bacterium]|nr:nuclear transport factor 2 family protein [Oscillospiraceae bacterium]MBQ7130443.1 nuclear transport factor 2 family protein [Oscillospiraceae bacterium]